MPQYTAEEAKQKANLWYEEKLRAQVETPENFSKVLVIDVETGDYEVAKDTMEAYQRLRIKQPEGFFFFRRIGFPTHAKMGGSWGVAKS